MECSKFFLQRSLTNFLELFLIFEVRFVEMTMEMDSGRCWNVVFWVEVHYFLSDVSFLALVNLHVHLRGSIKFEIPEICKIAKSLFQSF